MLIEFLTEFIGSLLIEGSLEAGTSKRVPMPLRILLLVLFFGFYIGLIGIITVCGINNAKNGNIFAAAVLFAIAVFIALMVIVWFIKTCKEKRNNN